MPVPLQLGHIKNEGRPCPIHIGHGCTDIFPHISVINALPVPLQLVQVSCLYPPQRLQGFAFDHSFILRCHATALRGFACGKSSTFLEIARPTDFATLEPDLPHPTHIMLSMTRMILAISRTYMTISSSTYRCPKEKHVLYDHIPCIAILE